MGGRVSNDGLLNAPADRESIPGTEADLFDNRSAQTKVEAAGDAFMASLDVDLPVRGREYFFTTPRGEVKLSAQGVATRVYQRLYASLAVLAIAAGAWVIYLLCVRLTQTLLGAIAVGCVLVLLGVISLVQGYLPIYGGLALLAAIVLFISKLEMRTAQTT